MSEYVYTVYVKIDDERPTDAWCEDEVTGRDVDTVSLHEFIELAYMTEMENRQAMIDDKAASYQASIDDAADERERWRQERKHEEGP